MKWKFIVLALLLISASSLRINAQASTQSPLPISYVLTSTLLAALVSAIVSAFIAVRLKDKEYKNEYYKKVIEKRIVAYGYLESQIIVMRDISVNPNDKRGYLLMFGRGKEFYEECQVDIQKAIKSGLWLTPATLSIAGKINTLLLNVRLQYDISEPEKLRQAGKDYFKEILKLRFELEKSVREDIYSLHDVKSFFKLSRLDDKDINFDSVLDFSGAQKPK